MRIEHHLSYHIHLEGNVVSLSKLSAVQDLEESFAELAVEGGIDDGVEGTVYVAKPYSGSVQFWRDVTGLTVGIQYVC